MCHFSVLTITLEQFMICSKTHLDGNAHEQAIICWRLIAGHVMGSRRVKRKNKMRRMVILCS